MLFEIRAFNCKGTVFRVIFDNQDMDVLERATDAIDTDTVVLRDELEEEKLNKLCMIIKALNAIDRAEKGGIAKNGETD